MMMGTRLSRDCFARINEAGQLNCADGTAHYVDDDERSLCYRRRLACRCECISWLVRRGFDAVHGCCPDHRRGWTHGGDQLQCARLERLSITGDMDVLSEHDMQESQDFITT